MTDIASEIRDTLKEFLEQRSGESFSLAGLQKRLRMGLASIRYAMATLENDGTVKRVSGECQARYYIPNAKQKALMGGDMESKPWPVLKPRTEHASVIARIREQRNAIQSIG